MLTKGIKKYIANPIIGILPFVLYIILHTYFINGLYALLISLGVAIIGRLALRNYFKDKIQGLTFYITAVALGLTALLWVFGNSWIEEQHTYILIAEILIIVQLMIFRLSKTLLKARLFKRKSFLEKALLDDFFLIAAILQYVLTIHAILILAYKQITIGYVNVVVDNILYVVTPIVIIVGLCIYQALRTSNMVNKLRTEEWLPIVTENGDVTGRIARKVSMNMKNKYMHPVVRIALICNKKIYLQERELKYIVDPGKIDHPFEKYMLFKHEVNTAAHNSIKRILGRDVEQEPHFVFKYVFENELTKRLVFLFTINIDDESQVTKTKKMTGKFWTVKQIDEEFGDQIFSECFELEYEYLKHMILLEDTDYLIAEK